MRPTFGPDKSSLLAILTLAALAGFILFAFKDFSDRCFAYTYKINEQRLQELSAQNVDAIKIELNRAAEAVGIAAAGFALLERIDSPTGRGMLAAVMRHSGFDRMWLVDRAQNAFDKDSHTLKLAEPDFLKNALAGNSGITKVMRSNYTQKPIFAAYAPVPSGAAVEYVLVGVYDPDSLVARTQNPQFGGLGYTQVFDLPGNLVFSSKNGNLPVDAGNIWDFLQRVTFGPGQSYEQVRRDVEAGGQGTVLYRQGDQERMACYAPVGINDWFIISAAPASVVHSYSGAINSFAFGLLMKVLACFALLIAGIIYYARRSHAAVVRVNSLLDISNQRFRVAAFQLYNSVVEYDAATGAMYRVEDSPLPGEAERPITDLATGLIRNRVIEPNSLKGLAAVLDRMRRGEKFGSCLLKAEDAGGGVEWHHAVFTSVFDAEGKPARTVGTIENVTAQKEIEQRFAREERYRQAMLGEAVETFVFDLTRERYVYGHTDRKSGRSDPGPADARVLDGMIRRLAHPDFQERIALELSLDRLRRSFSKGVSRVETVFRGLNTGDGGERWLSCTVNLVLDPETKGLMGYAYVKDVTEIKLTELALKREAERDPLTGLYNRKAANRLIEQRLREDMGEDRGTIDAFLLVDLDHFKQINDTYGHATGDEALRSLAAALTGIFRKSDIVARMGGDEFFVFMKDAVSVDQALDKAAAICRALKEIILKADPDRRLTGSVGVCPVPARKTALEEIYDHADLALYAAKRDGKDRYRLYDESMERNDAAPIEPNALPEE